jgi:hypothetical protein
MQIPTEWLMRRVTSSDVEEEAAENEAADAWLEQWLAFFEKFSPGDELWEFGGAVYQEPPSQDVVGSLEEHVGFARVRDGEVLDFIEAPWLM